MSQHRSIASYDKYLCLKPNLLMWLIFLLLMKPYVVTLLSIVNPRDRTGLIDLVYADRVALVLGALAAVPVAFLVHAWSQRRPDASAFVKSVWAKGRMLLAVSALLNIGVVFFPLLAGTAHHLTGSGLTQIAIAVVIVVLVYTSGYIRDCFNDFPEGAAAGGKPRG